MQEDVDYRIVLCMSTFGYS